MPRSLPKYLYRNRPRAALTVVEIDAAVVRCRAQYFKLPEDPRRLAIEIADGHDYVSATDRRYDLIVVDGYDAKCRVGMLDTLPFYCACRARLTDAGLLVTNFLNRHRGLGGSLKRMDGAFGSRVCALPACSSGNIIALAATGSAIEVSLAQLKSGALALKRDTGLNLLPIVARIARLQAGDFGPFRALIAAPGALPQHQAGCEASANPRWASNGSTRGSRPRNER